MVTTNATDDTAKILTIPRSSLENMGFIEQKVIAHAVAEAVATGDNYVDVQTVLGILHIYFDAQQMKIKLEPFTAFEKMLRNAALTGTSPVATAAEISSAQKMTQAFKDLVIYDGR